VRNVDVLQIQAEMPGEPEDGGDPLAPNREAFLRYLEAAERFDPDFVSFPELVLAADTNRDERPLEELSISLPGPFLDRVGERADALDSYVWVPTYERAGDDVYNAVALVSPDGDYLGTYRKVAPTVNELTNRGVTPGTELPVWETEFGRVGATICWDLRFDDVALAYRAEGLDLMFHPSHGLGHGKLEHWATYHGFHIAYCFTSDCFTSDACVFTPTGDTRGWVSSHPTMPTLDAGEGLRGRYSLATVNTDMACYNQGTFDYEDSELTDLQQAYPESVRIHTHPMEGFTVVESTAEDVTVEELAAEYRLSRTEDAESRTRELVAGVTADSPLFDPGDRATRRPVAVVETDGGDSGSDST